MTDEKAIVILADIKLKASEAGDHERVAAVSMGIDSIRAMGLPKFSGNPGDQNLDLPWYPEIASGDEVYMKDQVGKDVLCGSSNDYGLFVRIAACVNYCDGTSTDELEADYREAHQ